MQVKSFSRAAERRSQRREQIVVTASKLFSERGYENVTLRAIAERLGYAHAALYRYFPDKASLLGEICKETFDRLIVELDANTWWISLFGITQVLIRRCDVIGPASSDEVIQRHIQVMWQGFRTLSAPAAPKPKRPVRKQQKST